VILAERSGLPLVSFWMTADAGYAADHSAAPGTAKLMSAMLVDGTRTRNALQINDQVAMLGANLQAYSDLDFSYVQLSALKEKLDPSLELFGDVIVNPSFPEADFKREQKLQLDGIQQEEDNPIGMALRVFPGLVYGSDNAYGNPFTGSGTAGSVQKITRDDLVKFHREWFQPGNATLVVVGDTTLAEITPKLEKLFAGWKSGNVPQKNVAAVKLPAKPVVYLLDKPNAEQSLIIAANITQPPNTPEELAIQAMNDVLGGTFSSRLNMNIREDKHWSYGASSFVLGARFQRTFLGFAPVQTDKTKESLVEVNKELRGILGDHPVTPEELARTQANETLSLPGSRETLDAVGGSITTILDSRWPDDYYDTMSGKIRALKTSDLDAAAKQVIHPDNMIWIVVGDRAKIEAGIRELNLGEIHLIDANGNPI
jgi:zinc protease